MTNAAKTIVAAAEDAVAPAALCGAPSMEKLGQTRVGHMQLHSHIGVLNLDPWCPLAALEMSRMFFYSLRETNIKVQFLGKMKKKLKENSLNEKYLETSFLEVAEFLQ